MLYKRGNVWWFKFVFAGRTVRESSKSASKVVARDAERRRRRDLEEGYHGLRKRQPPVLFSIAAGAWLAAKQLGLAPKSYAIEALNVEKHLNPVFGKMLLTDINADDVGRYQRSRLEQGAAPKTVNLEVGTLRAILRRHRLWERLRPDVGMLATPDDLGRALSEQEEETLLQACALSRSRSLLPAVTLALNTGMRVSEIRLLRWRQVDLVTKTLTVGQSKTDAGTGRAIPLNQKAAATLTFWASLFENRQPQHHVFPSEQYGLAGNNREACAHDADPATPIGSWKTAWTTARKKAGVAARFHDLRHTAVSRLLERGVPLSVVASIMGWSASTMTKMAKRYAHFTLDTQRKALETLDRVPATTAASDASIERPH